MPVNSMNELLINTECDKNETVYVLCNGGGRAPIGCSFLKAHGYTNVIHVQGGMSKLKQTGIQLI